MKTTMKYYTVIKTNESMQMNFKNNSKWKRLQKVIQHDVVFVNFKAKFGISYAVGGAVHRM